MPVSGFRLHLRETVGGCRQINSWTSANARRVKGFCVRLCERLVGCTQAAVLLQMLCLSGDFVCVYVKRWLGEGNLDPCKCCACQGVSFACV